MNRNYNFWAIRYRVSTGLVLISQESNKRVEINREIARIRENTDISQLEAINTLIHNIVSNIGYEEEFKKVTYNCTAAELEELQSTVRKDIIDIFTE